MQPIVTHRTAGTESFVSFRNADGFDGRGTLLHLTRQVAVFEVYNPHSIVQLSEVLKTLRISRGNRLIYGGRAVVSGLVPTGAMVIVSATLVDPWNDMQGLETEQELLAETRRFIDDWQQSHRLNPRFQLAVTTLASFLGELSRWINEAEVSLGVAAEPGHTLDLYESVREPVIEKVSTFIGEFEDSAREISNEDTLVHRAFTQRELHPLLLTAPFVHRSYTKPLGYAGDFEMVNMMLDEPGQGPNAYARILNSAHVSVGPAAAHRNRIDMLVDRLVSEAQRAHRQSGLVRILNVGCGPAAEVSKFLSVSELSDACHFTLMDFNEPTLNHARERLDLARSANNRRTQFEWRHKSIHELLREAVKRDAPVPEYDLVYCAGLYDYLTDRVCARLTSLFYSMVRPGGLVVATNVHASNPVRHYMEFLVEWYLVYRDEKKMLELAKHTGRPSVSTDTTGVNVFLDIRKPE